MESIDSLSKKGDPNQDVNEEDFELCEVVVELWKKGLIHFLGIVKLSMVQVIGKKIHLTKKRLR